MAEIKIPYDANGNLMHYPQTAVEYLGEWKPGVPQERREIPPDWRPNTPFVATLTLDTTIRGQSAAYFMWHDDEGRAFPMFMADLADVIRNATISQGRIGPRTWVVGKRGKNYGVRLAAAKDGD